MDREVEVVRVSKERVRVYLFYSPKESSLSEGSHLFECSLSFVLLFRNFTLSLRNPSHLL